MKIGLDTRTLETAHRFRGIGVYSVGLLKALSEVDQENNYTFFTQSKPSAASKIVASEGFSSQDQLISKSADPSRYNWLMDQFSFPLAVKKSQVQLVHILEQLSSPIMKSAKTVVTVCDLVQIAKGYPGAWKNRLKIWPIHFVDKIIAISQATKNDLINILHIPEKKIKVIYCGYDQKTFSPINEPKKLSCFREKLVGRKAKYFLYLGSYEVFEPRKNLDFLLEVFNQFLAANKTKKTFLVMVGKTGEETNRIKKIAREKNLGKQLIFTGFVPTEDLSLYLQAAEALLFPSLQEGFGLPPLEAMACGCPVISSNRGPLPEVVGKAGLINNPQNTLVWVNAMIRIFSDGNLKKSLARRGREQAKKFSWEKCARETLALYQEVINSKTTR